MKRADKFLYIAFPALVLWGVAGGAIAGRLGWLGPQGPGNLPPILAGLFFGILVGGGMLYFFGQPLYYVALVLGIVVVPATLGGTEAMALLILVVPMAVILEVVNWRVSARKRPKQGCKPVG